MEQSTQGLREKLILTGNNEVTFRIIKEKDDNHKVETDLFSHWGEKKDKAFGQIHCMESKSKNCEENLQVTIRFRKNIMKNQHSRISYRFFCLFINSILSKLFYLRRISFVF